VIAETKPERAAWSAAIAKVEQLQTDAEKGFAFIAALETGR
jgi:hypothetical protein